MVLVPRQLNNLTFSGWLNEAKTIDKPILWDRSQARRFTLVPVDILNSTFSDPMPQLVGWYHRFGYAFRVVAFGKIFLMGLDSEGHQPSYVDPCSGLQIGASSHVHRFDEQCPGLTRREPAPPEVLAMGNDASAALGHFLGMINTEYLSIEQAAPISLQRRII